MTITIAFNQPFAEALQAAAERGVVLPDVYYGELQGIARQLAFSIAGLASLDQLQQVKDSLDKALLEGQSFGKWKKQILASGTLDLPTHRLDNIFRTNIQSNYMAGKWERFREVKDLRPYLMYDAINDSRVRPAHLALDGIIRRVDDPFWATHSPVNGYRCRCTLKSLSEQQALDRSKNGNGLNKQAVLPDGTPALPDKGWDYNPGDRLGGVKRAIQKRDQTASPLLKQALDAKLEDMKTVTPAIPVKWRGKVDVAFKDEVKAAIKSLPINVLSRLEIEGCTIEACRRIVTAFPELKGVTPRGWPSNKTWDNADGFARGSKIVVAEEYKFFKKYYKSNRVGGVFRHEAGHVLDRALGEASSTLDYMQAYIEDSELLKQQIGHEIFNYLLQEGEAGRQESFAEIFAQLHGSGSSTYDAIKAFPKTTEVIRKMIKEA